MAVRSAVAQQVEHPAFTRKSAGSIPAGGTALTCTRNDYHCTYEFRCGDRLLAVIRPIPYGGWRGCRINHDVPFPGTQTQFGEWDDIVSAIDATEADCQIRLVP